MALITCSECHREISDLATACPQCGCPQGTATPAGSPASGACPPPIPSPTPSRWWIASGGKADGPFNEAYVVASLQGSAISAGAMACPVGGSDWRPLGQWAQFAQVLSRTSIAGSSPLPFPVASSPPLLDFAALFTNPRLPRMANWICVYCIGIVPCLLLLDLFNMFVFGGLTASLREDSPALGFGLMVDVIDLLLPIAIAVLLMVGGIKLKQLRRAGTALTLVGLWTDLGFFAFRLLGLVPLLIILGSLDPDALGADTSGVASNAVAFFEIVLGLAAIVFEVFAVVWLHRHGRSLPVADLR